MAAKTWVLTDVVRDVYEPHLRIDASLDSELPPGVSVVQRTLRGGLSDGVNEVRVDNGRFAFSILPTRGMGLWRGWLGGQTVGWHSPVRGPVHPCHVPLTEATGLGWLDGFDEWICRCGAVSNGAPDFDAHGRLIYPLHGRLANLPARYVEVSIDGDAITVRGIVEECRFHFQKLQLTTAIKTWIGQARLEIHDEVKNLSGSPTDMQMLYHCNFGVPLLGAGAEVVLPAEIVVPRNDWAAAGLGHWSTYSEPTAGMQERVYFFRMWADAADQTLALLKSVDGRHGVSLSWNAKQLPCFSLWKNETSLQDGYVTGLEPGTNFPNPHSFESQRQRVVKLGAGESHTMQLALQLHADTAAVQAAEQKLRELQADRPCKLVAMPDPDWCA
jgi:hypothetical protein